MGSYPPLDDNDRAELREMFAGTPGVRPPVSVTDDEFEAVFKIQCAMRAEISRLGDLMDARAITAGEFFDMSGDNMSKHFRAFKNLLGEQRYKDVFDTTETDDMIPMERDVFVAAQNGHPSSLL